MQSCLGMLNLESPSFSSSNPFFICFVQAPDSKCRIQGTNPSCMASTRAGKSRSKNKDPRKPEWYPHAPPPAYRAHKVPRKNPSSSMFQRWNVIPVGCATEGQYKGFQPKTWLKTYRANIFWPKWKPRGWHVTSWWCLHNIKKNARIKTLWADIG